MPIQQNGRAYASYLNVSGIMTASKISGTLIDTSGDMNVYTRDWEAAYFSGPYQTFTGDVSAVSLNATPLHSGASAYFDYFVHYDSSVLWNNAGLNHWNVSASTYVPAISADVPGTMPAFTGTLSTSISTATSFSFTFNSSNTTNADSAYFVIYCAGGYWYSNVISPNGGTASVSAETMSFCHNDYTGLTGFASDTNIYYGGILMIVLYNHQIQTFGGKQFAFVKQREILSVVKFD